MSSTAQQADTTPRYFCYACNREVPIYMAPDPTCQRCNEQFVQEIEPESDPQTFLNGDGDATGVADAGPERPNAYIRYDSQNGNDLFQFLDAFGPGERSDEPSGGSNDNRSSAAAMSSVLQNMLTMLMSQVPESAANDQASDEEGDGDRQPRSQQSHSMVFYGGMVDGHLQFRPMNLSPQRQQQGENASGSGENSSNTAHPSTEEGAAAGDGGDNRVNNFASSLLRLLYGLSEGVVGNPNDYVFSQDGFDNIITQLMEQASGRNAPPPAPETVIDTLPKRPLNDKEIEDKTDCAVCKDEFGPTEIVNELPCQHVFHEDCIKPWLKVNGTCPVCRHSVLPEKSEGAALSENNDTNSHGDNGSSSSNPDQATTTTNTSDAPTSPPQTSTAEGLPPPLSSLLGDPRRQLPSLAGWFNNFRNMNNQRQQQQQPSMSSPPSSSSNNNNSNSNSNNNNTPQQSSRDSNNRSTTDPSEMDLDLD